MLRMHLLKRTPVLGCVFPSSPKLATITQSTIRGCVNSTTQPGAPVLKPGLPVTPVVILDRDLDSWLAALMAGVLYLSYDEKRDIQ